MSSRGGPRGKILDRYVIGGERVVFATRHHWGMLVEPVATTLAALLVVAWIVVEVGPAVGDGVLVLWWLWLILVGRLVWRVMEWRNEWFVATDKRLLLLYGLITHKVAMMPLKKVTDMNYGRSPVGRVLGYGQFLLESAGQDQALRKIDWVGRPDETYRRLCDTLFGPSGPDLDDDAPLKPPVPAPRAHRAPAAEQPANPDLGSADGPAGPREVEPAEPWDGRSPVDSVPHPESPPRPERPVVVVPGREAGDEREPTGGSTQPIPVHQPRPAHHAHEDTEDERGWAVSGEHRATYVALVHPESPPLPKPYEPGPGRDEAP